MIVSDVRSLESTGGRKAMALKINENCRFALGIALTPRHVKLSLINLKKEVIDDIRIRHNKKDIESIIDIAKENINKILNNKDSFRELRQSIENEGLIYDWYDYREGAERNLAIKWCNDNNIEY